MRKSAARITLGPAFMCILHYTPEVFFHVLSSARDFIKVPLPVLHANHIEARLRVSRAHFHSATLYGIIFVCHTYAQVYLRRDSHSKTRAVCMRRAGEKL